MRRFQQTLTEWSRGAIATDLGADKLPINACPRARNTAWSKLGLPAKRQGCSTLTQASENSAAILGLGTFGTLNWTIDSDGKWSKIVSGVYAPIDASEPSPFTAGTHYPSTAIADNYLFAVNGIEAVKTNGTTITKFGIVAPAAPTVGTGAAGNPNGTYQIALTSYNSSSGHESSLGPATSVSPTNTKITVSWTFPTDTQVDYVRVHIFKLGLTDRFFRLGSTDVTPTPNVTTGGYASGTTSITINVTDTDINNLTIQSPGLHDNDPPPAGTTYLFYHGSRMFATDGKFLFYSKVDDPESFNPLNYESVSSGDGTSILAMASIGTTSADQQLVIFKRSSVHALVGPNDPNTWEIDTVDPTIGITSPRGVVQCEGEIWWVAEQGIFRLQAVSPTPTRMDVPGVDDHVALIAHNSNGIITAAYDSLRQRILFAVPEATRTINTMMLSYNWGLKIWEDIWDPMDISVLGNMTLLGEPFVALGGYLGRVFRMWQTPYVDGVRTVNGATTYTLNSTVTAATSNTLTDSTATFDTDGDGLAGIVVLALGQDGRISRNIIVSNTTTVLTLRDTWDADPVPGNVYVIGSPMWEFDTMHMAPTSVPNTLGSVFNTRRFKHALIKASTNTGAAVFDIYALIDSNLDTFAAMTSVTIFGGGARWDEAKWDEGIFAGGDAVTATHLSLGISGRTCGLRVRNIEPGVGAFLIALGLFGTEHTYHGYNS